MATPTPTRPTLSDDLDIWRRTSRHAFGERLALALRDLAPELPPGPPHWPQGALLRADVTLSRWHEHGSRQTSQEVRWGVLDPIGLVWLAERAEWLTLAEAHLRAPQLVGGSAFALTVACDERLAGLDDGESRAWRGILEASFRGYFGVTF